MDIKIEGTRATIHGLANGKRLLPILPKMEGQKRWLKSGGFSFETTPLNIELFKKVIPEAEFPATERAEGTAVAPRRRRRRTRPRPSSYESQTAPYDHQKRAEIKWGNRHAFALFMEMGTGKSKVAIDHAGRLWCADLIDAVLVVSPKGVHEQWVNDQVPEHLGSEVPRVCYAWNKKKLPKTILQTEDMAWFTINIDALKTRKGEEAAVEFITAHGGRVLTVVDESHSIKNPSAKRTEVCYALAELCSHRVIMTGTPIAKNLLDEWSQFKFLDERIIGMRYATSFKARYCIVDKDSHQIIGSKNVEGFYARVDPWSFRVTKEEELDLPPKVYDRHQFEMTDRQNRHYEELKTKFLTEVEEAKERLTVTHIGTMLLRLQQITCGYMLLDDGTLVKFNENPRLDALKEVVSQRSGKTIIWARFHEDIEQLMFTLGDRAVAYYGPISPKKREANKAAFRDPDSGIDYFVATTDAGGEGTDRLQGNCRTAIYYSNSFNSIKRWQSEDRIHRIGTVGTVTYIDLICNRSVDKRILANLRAKKQLSDLVLDDIRRILEGE